MRARLDSWKAIAEYLGRDVRTAQRWERDRGLPVHRVPGAGRSAVFADTSDIDEWLRQRRGEGFDSTALAEDLPAPDVLPQPAPSRRTLLVWTGAVVLLLAVAGWSAFGTGQPDLIDRVDVSATTLDVFTASGAKAWSARLPLPAGHTAVAPRAALVSSSVFAGAGVVTGASQGADTGGRAWLFTPAGDLAWEHHADAERVSYGGTTYEQPWVLEDWSAGRHGAGWRVVLAWRHYVWWPSFVQVLDPVRSTIFRFDNPGWIRRAGWADSNAQRLVVTGASNPHDSGMAALLDVNGGAAAAPPGDDATFRCDRCGPGRPLRYAVFPRSEVNRQLGAEINLAIFQVLAGRIVVHTSESDIGADRSWGGAEVVYEFDLDLNLTRAAYGDKYWEAHARLEQAGRIRHSRAACPDRDGPPAILTWEPATGWAPDRRR